MKTNEISLTFNGIGAACYLCIGFIPDELEIRAVEDAELARVFWGRGSRAAESDNGYMVHAADQTLTLYTAGNGVEPYEGGDIMDTVNQTSVAYGEGIYLKRDTQLEYKGDTTNAVAAPIYKWTLGNSTNRTGNCNADLLATTRIGEGSIITIREEASNTVKEAVVEAWAASAGEGANEITLSRAIKSGVVLGITGMYDMIPVPIGETTPPGFKLNPYADINVDGEIQELIATQYEN